jgi:hypothetical protein
MLLEADKLDHLITVGKSVNAPEDTIPINSCSTRYAVIDKNEIREFVATRKITPPKKHTL